MKKIKIGLSGSAGRMGKEIEALLSGHQDFDYQCAVDRFEHTSCAQFFSKTFQYEKAKNLDVWVDFSSPENLLKISEELLKLKMPLVTGTTGLTDEQYIQLKNTGKQIPVFWAPNMSLGMALFRKALRAMSTTLSGSNSFSTEFLIEEVHHKHKKDKPSGTALEIEKVLKENKVTSLMPTVSIRAGSALGTHRVYEFLEDETILLEHVAQSRRIFAKGALFAAQWLVKQGPGVYTMDDILK